ncbi:MAG: 3-phosphoshikimate 1-carboxyvinyltransferase [Deltaproteobacteria bacterium]|jgi:3-phosphoshikimate 1-carboxyvinyltransferase|nr:3-phosphoshikimate 1-carboxyvinyltransferase [Deltaproteobacteria bacterium]
MTNRIQSIGVTDATVAVPGSKSYTHRALVTAALADGKSFIENGLFCDDTSYTMGALKKLGALIDRVGNSFTVRGVGGKPAATSETLQFGNAGTSIRFLTAVTALGKGTYTLAGNARMSERPIQDLLDGLNQTGSHARSINGNGCPPVCVEADGLAGGSLTLKANISSQYLSALLLTGPYTKQGIDMEIPGELVSRPYVTMTMEVMERFGAKVEEKDGNRFSVAGRTGYLPASVAIEPDASNSSYFWASAAITGTKIKVADIRRASSQGDLGFLDLLSAMGCHVEEKPDGVSVQGQPLRGIRADMGMMPDVVPTLAVVAAFAQGTTTISNVAHLKVKETDRLQAVKNELTKMGINVEVLPDGLIIEGGQPHKAVIDTYDDHRIAMCFAAAGLAVPGIEIRDPGCVEKSFPTFWETLAQLY